jgi:hypothetical protein
MLVIYYLVMTENEMTSHPLIQNKVKYLKEVSSQTGMKIIDGELIPKNEIFSAIEEFIKAIPQVEGVKRYDIEIDQINTLVESKKGFKLKVHPHITFSAPDGSLIRFSPYKKDGLEISRIQSAKIGSGMGTRLMEDFLIFSRTYNGYSPLIYLECTGAVGWGDNRVNMEISEQTRFFRKFGFRVRNGKRYPKWVDMVRPAEVPPSTPSLS